MTGFDFVVLAVITASVILGMVRGLVREVLSLIAYAAAILGAVWWAPSVHDVLLPYIQNDLLRLAVAYVGVFLAVLTIVGLINLAVSGLIRSTGLAPADRGLGAIFGLVRAGLLIMVLVVAAGYTPLPAEPWWRQAWLAPAVEQGVVAVKHQLPASVAHWVPYPYAGPQLLLEASGQPHTTGHTPVGVP